MGISIRRAVLADAGTVGFVTSVSWQAAYKGIVPDDYLAGITPEHRAERFKAVLPLLQDVEFYLVSVDDMPAGVMNLHVCRDEDARDCGEIGVFYFLPEYWGRGCAACAMRFAQERLKARGFSAAVLWVLEENGRARRFYEKQGFQADGGRKTVNLGKELADIRYRKPLRKGGL